MEQKNRLLIVFAITSLIIFAMFTSFGRNLFALNTPKVVLPSTAPSSPDDTSLPSSELYQPVEVTPQTVTGVVATLARPASYYRELSVEQYWDGGSSTSQVQVWTDDGWSHSRQVLPSGAVRHDLVGDGTLYYWYDGSQQYQTAPADERSSDLAQRIPTYETVLALDPGEITAAGYELRGEQSCIYVEVQPRDTRLISRYWVSVDSGLLVSAELEENGQLAYRMTAYAPVQSPCPADASFDLPDGSHLHTVGG